jgi:hypothetical protein
MRAFRSRLEAQAILAALVLLAGERKSNAAFALADLLSRRGLERPCETTCRVGSRGVELTAWPGASGTPNRPRIQTALDNGQRSPEAARGLRAEARRRPVGCHRESVATGRHVAD